MKKTGFKDVDKNPIYEGQAVEFWDDEGGHGIGIISMNKEHGWMIIDPSHDFREDGHLWCITTLEAFKNNVRLMKYKDGEQ